MSRRLYGLSVFAALVFAGAGISQELAVSNVQTASGSVYQVDNLSVGKNVYIDRDYTFSNVSVYDGQLYIRTSNADPDVMNTSSDFLSFDINIAATVYVAHDKRNSLPSWLDGWSNTGKSLQSVGWPTGAAVYSKAFEAGTVTLGGNAGTESMYSVIMAAGTGVSTSGDTPELDRYLLLGFTESKTDAELTVGQVEKSGPLFGEDKPWEPRFDNVYTSVVYDSGYYKMWYNPFVVDERTTSTPIGERNPTDRPNYMGINPNGRVIALCYATSTDGIEWVKPELGLIDFDGSTANNIVMMESHGVGVFRDPVDTDPARRYKAFFSSFDFGENNDMTIAYSGDGINWSQWVNAATIGAPGDSHNNAFWDPYTQRYMGYTRDENFDAGRIVTFTTSQDFMTWTHHHEVFGIYDDDYAQSHDMIVFPTGGVYLGLLGKMVFKDPNNKVWTPDMPEVRQHVELMWSPDGESWNWIDRNTPFIGHTEEGPEPPAYGEMPYDWGTIFASPPVFLEDETRIYYSACDWYFFDWRKGYIALATIRPDRWAGYEPGGTGVGTVTTVPVKFLGSELSISADVAAGGSVGVTLLDENDSVLAVSDDVTDTVTDGLLSWKDGFTVGSVDRENVKLRFEFQKAKVYSFFFSDTAQISVAGINRQTPQAGYFLDYVQRSALLSMISYSLPSSGDVSIRLFDMRGRCQAVLSEGRRKAGNYTTSLNISGLAAGSYTIHLSAGGRSVVRKITVYK